MSFACPPAPIVPYEVFCGTRTDATNLDTFNFVGCALSNPSDDRLIVVCVGSRDTASTGAVHGTMTVAGITATKVLELISVTVSMAIYTARVPTGTTGTIAVALDDTTDHLWISVYALYGLVSTMVVDTDTANADPATFAALAVRSGGIVIAAAGGITGTAYTTTGLTEDADEALETMRYVSGSAQNTIGATAFTASFDTAVAAVGVAASFR
jgi:hypothetical protein